MFLTGSGDGPPALPLVAVLAAVVVGTAAMFLSMVFVAPLGLRPALVVSECLLLAPAALAALVAGLPLGDSVGLRALPRRTLLLSLLTGASLWLASLGLFELQYSVWRPDPNYLQMFRRLHELLRPHGPLDAGLSLLAIAIAPALCEELLMRGLLLPALLRRVAPPLAVVLTALAFGAIHMDAYRFPFTFVAGLVLGVLRLATGTVTAPMLAHALLNAVTLAVAPFSEDPGPGLPDPRPLLGLAAFAAGAAATVALLRTLTARRPSLTAGSHGR